MKIFMVAALGGALLSLSASAADYVVPAAHADLISASGEKIGTAIFTQTSKGVRIDLSVTGIPAGEHAVHVHQTGKCEPDTNFMSSGGHFNPTGKTHGMKSESPEHEGDLPNETANSAGVLKASMTTDNFSVAGLFDADGSAIVVHALPDDYMTQPTGNAGGRIACGVVMK